MISCPYCNKLNEEDYYGGWAECKNHNDVIVITYPDKDIEMHSPNYLIFIDKQTMHLYKIISEGKEIEELKLDLSIDPLLTPENFDKKVKTYLMFL